MAAVILKVKNVDINEESRGFWPESLRKGEAGAEKQMSSQVSVMYTACNRRSPWLEGFLQSAQCLEMKSIKQDSDEEKTRTHYYDKKLEKEQGGKWGKDGKGWKCFNDKWGESAQLDSSCAYCADKGRCHREQRRGARWIPLEQSWGYFRRKWRVVLPQSGCAIFFSQDEGMNHLFECIISYLFFFLEILYLSYL